MGQIKNSAIIYTAYDYQTLHGVYLLACWLNSPNEYERICFEADADTTDAPQGIDDIVCKRTDGKVDFRQVKFTPSPEKEENHFTWDWLLSKSGKTERSRSIVKKISDAISQVDPNLLGNVILITNKIPDRTMENCIKDEKIDFSRIPTEIQQIIISQLGDSETAHSFFNLLEIQHSEGDYPNLLRSLRGAFTVVNKELYRLWIAFFSEDTKSFYA